MIYRRISSEQVVGDCNLTTSVEPLNTAAVSIQLVQFMSWTFVTFEAFAATARTSDSLQTLGPLVEFPQGKLDLRTLIQGYPLRRPYISPSPLASEVCLPIKRNKIFKVSVVRIILCKQIPMVTQYLTNRRNVMMWPIYIGPKQYTACFPNGCFMAELVQLLSTMAL